MPVTTFSVAIDCDAPMPELVGRARRAEAMGFDIVYVPDHSRDWRVDPKPGDLWFDGWTVLAAMAAGTSTVRLGTLVSNPILRPPGLLARQALAVDHLSGGRLELGIGTGIAPFDHAATGTDKWSVSERVARFTEYVEVVDLLLRAGVEADGRAAHDGAFFRGRHEGLAPAVQQPRPPLTLAGAHHRVLEVAAARAECWNTHGKWGVPAHELVDHLGDLNRAVDELCESVRRDPATLRRSVLLLSPLDPWTAEGRFAELTGQVAAVGFDEVCVFWPWHPAAQEVFESEATRLDELRGVA